MTHPKRTRSPQPISARSIIDIPIGQQPSSLDNKDQAAVALGKESGTGRVAENSADQQSWPIPPTTQPGDD
jgi:hypothetical protein